MIVGRLLDRLEEFGSDEEVLIHLLTDDGVVELDIREVVTVHRDLLPCPTCKHKPDVRDIVLIKVRM